MKRRILGIDGMYFANRVLGGMTSQNETLTLEPEQEQKNFLSNLHNSLWSIVRSFNNDTQTLINNVVIFCDYGSWRKDIPVYIPEYYKDVDEIKQPVFGYKENRVKKKQESPVNYKIFYELVSQFMEDVKSQIPVIKIPGLEGDDCICIMSHMLKNSQNAEMIIFCTDGDLEQCVNDNVILFRNIRSKECPNGEIVISQRKYHELFVNSSNDPITKLIGDNSERNYYKMLFSVQLNSEYPVQRKPEKDIRYACPSSVALKKIICGDAKDNVFPILRKVGETRNRSVSEKEMIKAIEPYQGKITDIACSEVIYDDKLRSDVFFTMRSVFKLLPDYPLDKIEEHFQHNKKLILLTPQVIGKERIQDFVKFFQENVKEKLEHQIEVPKKEREIHDNATQLYADSVKGII